MRNVGLAVGLSLLLGIVLTPQAGIAIFIVSIGYLSRRVVLSYANTIMSPFRRRVASSIILATVLSPPLGIALSIVFDRKGFFTPPRSFAEAYGAIVVSYWIVGIPALVFSIVLTSYIIWSIRTCRSHYILFLLIAGSVAGAIAPVAPFFITEILNPRLDRSMSSLLPIVRLSTIPGMLTGLVAASCLALLWRRYRDDEHATPSSKCEVGVSE